MVLSGIRRDWFPGRESVGNATPQLEQRQLPFCYLAYWDVANAHLESSNTVIIGIGVAGVVCHEAMIFLVATKSLLFRPEALMAISSALAATFYCLSLLANSLIGLGSCAPKSFQIGLLAGACCVYVSSIPVSIRRWLPPDPHLDPLLGEFDCIGADDAYRIDFHCVGYPGTPHDGAFVSCCLCYLCVPASVHCELANRQGTAEAGRDPGFACSVCLDFECAPVYVAGR
jgi:hypothetical protein